MVDVLFTLDYEIHGNGEGCPLELMVEPTERLMDLFDEYGAKLTIMADIGEILRFKEVYESTGRDQFHYLKIASQLKRAVRRGHDVQLHIHSSYFKAVLDEGKWRQNWDEYSFAELPLARMTEMVRAGKNYLEDLLVAEDPSYACIAFRAANWSVNPSSNVVAALCANGIAIDTSVFKYGQRRGIVTFDYSRAASEYAPWRASDHDLCRADHDGRVWEFPIYSEARWIGAFLTRNRLKRVRQSNKHRIAQPQRSATKTGTVRSLARKLGALFRRHAWKADFNQCTGTQLIRVARRVAIASREKIMPLVTIGHSKLIDEANTRSLRPFLEFVAKRASEFRFGTFHDWKAAINPARLCVEETA